MRLTLATGYGTTELAASLPIPKGGVLDRARPTEPGRAGRLPTASSAAPTPGTASLASTWLALNTEARRESRNELRALAVLWAAGWLGLVFVCV